MRARFTWVIVGAVAALFVAAGVDELVSSDRGTAVSPTTRAASQTTTETAPGALPPTTTETATGPLVQTTTTTETATGPLPRCTRSDIGVSIEVRGGLATLVVRNVGTTACYRRPQEWSLLIEDQTGTYVGGPGGESYFGGYFAAGAEKIQSVGTGGSWCAGGGPFRAVATVGSVYGARRDNLSASEVDCSE
jgi:hypothetical protein